MIKLKSLLVGLASLSLLVSGMSVAHGKLTHGGPKKVTFKQVAPLLNASCVSCHNPERHPEKVDLTSYKAVMASGEPHLIVNPGHPETSSLVKYIDGTKKPQMPIGKAPLTTAQVALVKAWIKSGALK